MKIVTCMINLWTKYCLVEDAFDYLSVPSKNNRDSNFLYKTLVCSLLKTVESNLKLFPPRKSVFINSLLAKNKMASLLDKSSLTKLLLTSHQCLFRSPGLITLRRRYSATPGMRYSVVTSGNSKQQATGTTSTRVQTCRM